MKGFQNNLAQLFSCMRRCAIWRFHLGRSKVTVTWAREVVPGQSSSLHVCFCPFYTPEGSYYVIPPVVRPSVCPSVSNFSCAQLLLQFPSELFETCHNESPWCLVVHLGLRIWIAVCVLKLSAPDFWNNTLFTLNFCPGHNFHTIKGLNFKQPILHFNSFHWQAPLGVYAPLCEALVASWINNLDV